MRKDADIEQDEWETIGDLGEEDFDEPLEEDGLAGDIRDIAEAELEVGELVEEEIAEHGMEIEQPGDADLAEEEE